jgi:hypothetical protein
MAKQIDSDNITQYTYADALRKVLAIRAQRSGVYADDWKQQADWELLALIKLKVMRLQHFVIDQKDEKVYESREDTLIDVANYALFMLQNEIDKRREG